MLSRANFRAPLPEHVRSLEKVAQRSTVALAVVREVADRGARTLAMRRLDWRPNLLLRKDLCCKFEKKSPKMMSSLFSTSTTMGWTFKQFRVKLIFGGASKILSLSQTRGLGPNCQEPLNEDRP
jgi:hypothetical protein